jgi:hypothetical protein
VRDDDLDDEAWTSREVYALFGLAMYRCQVLETGLVNHMIAVRRRDGPALYRGQVPAVEAMLQERTMGKNVGEICRRLSVSERLASELQEAVKTRNWLAHRYFWERAAAFVTSKGKEKMMEELRDVIIPRLLEIDKHVEAETFAIMKQYGMTRETVQAEFDRLMTEVAQRGDGGFDWDQDAESGSEEATEGSPRSDPGGRRPPLSS